MSDFETEFLEALELDETFDAAREKMLRLQVTSEYSRKKRRLVIMTWVWQAVSLLLLVPGILMVVTERDVSAKMLGLALVIMGEAGLIVIKLWYWIVHARLTILRELKRLELRLMQTDRLKDSGGQ
ncbi:MAG: hypothetical protein JXL80_15250 [Planctomycetes bacterium]|nr:hypothetical protein [Planctomycetota bacterium]